MRCVIVLLALGALSGTVAVHIPNPFPKLSGQYQAFQRWKLHGQRSRDQEVADACRDAYHKLSASKQEELKVAQAEGKKRRAPAVSTNNLIFRTREKSVMTFPQAEVTIPQLMACGDFGFDHFPTSSNMAVQIGGSWGDQTTDRQGLNRHGATEECLVSFDRHLHRNMTMPRAFLTPYEPEEEGDDEQDDEQEGDDDSEDNDSEDNAPLTNLEQEGAEDGEDEQDDENHAGGDGSAVQTVQGSQGSTESPWPAWFNEAFPNLMACIAVEQAVEQEVEHESIYTRWSMDTKP